MPGSHGSSCASPGYYLQVSLQRFTELMQLPDGEIDLGLAALLIAQEEYPELDVDRYLAQLDELGHQARALLSPAMTEREQVQMLAQLLVWDHGFHGNEEDYYNPLNSFLNDVLERRTGIPITLTVVFIEVGRRAGVDVRGVGFPAHFLARLGDVVFDPFHDARILSEDDCRQLLARLSNSGMPFDARYLAPTPARQIVLRMLNNLKHIYLNARYYRKAIGVMNRLLLANPNAVDELRDRGAVYGELKQYAQAKADLEAYLTHVTNAEEAATVRQAIDNIDGIMALMD